jgi:hypothetical protein
MLIKLDPIENSIVLCDKNGLCYGLPEAADDDALSEEDDDVSKVLHLHRHVIEAAEADGSFYAAKGENAKRKEVECLLSLTCTKCKNKPKWAGQWGFLPLAVQNHISNGHTATRKSSKNVKVANGKSSITSFFGCTLPRAVASAQQDRSSVSAVSGKC